MSRANKLANKRAARESWMWSHDEKGKRVSRNKHSLHVFPFNRESLPSTDASRAWVASHRSTR